MLKSEFWDNIINHTDVNESFNLFLNTFYIFVNNILQCNMQLTMYLTAIGFQQEAKYLVSTTYSLHYKQDNQML